MGREELKRQLAAHLDIFERVVPFSFLIRVDLEQVVRPQEAAR